MNKFKGKNSKYNARKIIVDGIKFDSQMESLFYRLLKKKGIEFKMQVKFELQPGFKKRDKRYMAINYKCDFQIDDLVIDVKGMKTPVFNIKKKMFEYAYSELDLICVTVCPYKYHQHSIYSGYLEDGKWVGFIENEKLESLRKDAKNGKIIL